MSVAQEASVTAHRADRTNRSSGKLEQQHPAVVPVRCPDCNKLLAKCCVRGVVEIVCTRCGALVRSVFA